MNTRLAILGSVFAIASAAVAQQAVQWKVSDGGNGHWYSKIPSSGMTWTDCQSAATAVGGYLVSTPTEAEAEFVIGAWEPSGIFLGGFQDTTAPDFSEPAGGWRWVSGEPWGYNRWGGGEPNNSPSPENILVGYSNGLGWNDCRNFCSIASHYVVEWSADCNSDGIVDYGQILRGELADTDENGVPDVCEVDPCPGDVNSSGVVNATDISIILGAWGTNGGKFPRADTDGSGVVDAADLSVVLSGWGKCP